MSMPSRHFWKSAPVQSAGPRYSGTSLSPIFSDSPEPVMVSGMAPLAIRTMLGSAFRMAFAKRLCFTVY